MFFHETVEVIGYNEVDDDDFSDDETPVLPSNDNELLKLESVGTLSASFMDMDNLFHDTAYSDYILPDLQTVASSSETIIDEDNKENAPIQSKLTDETNTDAIVKQPSSPQYTAVKKFTNIFNRPSYSNEDTVIQSPPTHITSLENVPVEIPSRRLEYKTIPVIKPQEIITKSSISSRSTNPHNIIATEPEPIHFSKAKEFSTQTPPPSNESSHQQITNIHTTPEPIHALPSIVQPKLKKKIRHVQIQVRIPAQDNATQTDSLSTDDIIQSNLYVSLSEKLSTQSTILSKTQQQLQDLTQLNESMKTDLKNREIERNGMQITIQNMEGIMLAKQQEQVYMMNDMVEKDAMLDKVYLKIKRLLLEKEAKDLQIEYMRVVDSKR